MVDAIVKARLKSTSDPKEQALLRSLLGKVAIANAKLTYQRYKEIFAEAEWKELAKKGAQTQRVLWASTSTKDPSYPDVLYIEELIGPETVNTIPPQTLEAFRDHGKPKASLEADIDAAHDAMDTLEKVGISMKKVTDDLVTQAVKLFAEPFDKLLNTVDAKCKYASQAEVDAQTYNLPDPINQQLTEAIDDWKMAGKVRRLWARDASLWTGTDESNWMGWLGITEDQLAHKQHLEDIAKDVKSAGFKHALLLGMGGSSLCPEVFKMTFGKIDGFPELFVLDSTDPAQVKAFEGKVDIANTIFIVSSKSGSTLEPNIFKQYFFERVKQAVGADKAGSRFIAVTDPGSKFEQVAQADALPAHIPWRAEHRRPLLSALGFRHGAGGGDGHRCAEVFGSRGCNGHRLFILPAGGEESGRRAGADFGIAAKNKRDKVTLITSPGISDFGAWLEQLLAESTGKDGKGLIPVDREALGAPEVYGNDRVFAYIRLENGADAAQDKAVDAIAKAGHPVVRIALADTYNLGQEMFRWEIATAVAGSVIGINPFNQPDVEASKIATRKLTAEYEKTGSLPPESPISVRQRHPIIHRRKERRCTRVRCGKRQVSGRVPARASEAAGRRRLLRAAGIRADERAA